MRRVRPPTSLSARWVAVQHRYRLQLLCILHDTNGEAEGESQVGVGQVPVTEGLQPRQPVGNGVAVDAQSSGRLAQADRLEDGPERGQPVALDRWAPGQDRRQQVVGLPQTIGQVVQVAQQLVGRQARRPSHPRRIVQRVGRFQRRAGEGLGGRP